MKADEWGLAKPGIITDDEPSYREAAMGDDQIYVSGGGRDRERACEINGLAGLEEAAQRGVGALGCRIVAVVVAVEQIDDKVALALGNAAGTTRNAQTDDIRIAILAG